MQGMKPVAGATIRTPGYNRSLPGTDLRVAAFRLDATEVTEAQYAGFLSATGYFAPSAWNDRVAARQASPLPVTEVSLVDAMFYCAWRKTRLPTWGEWHLAAFGPAGHGKPWGDKPTDDVFSRGDKLTPVGTHPKSAGPLGFADIIGNAWEWCASPLVQTGRNDREITDHDRAVVLGGGQLRLGGGGRKAGVMDAIITEITTDDAKLSVFWDARERLPYAGPNQTLWGASVVNEDFMCVAIGGGSFWMGHPEEDARRYPRLCVVAGDFSQRSPTIGFRCAVSEVSAP